MGVFEPYANDIQIIFDLLGYAPTDHIDGGQRPVIECDDRFIVVSGGMQSGKSYTTKMVFWKHYPLAKARAEALRTEQVAWLVGEDYDACYKEFEYIKADAEYMGILVYATSEVKEGYIVLEGNVVIRVRSTHGGALTKLRSDAPFLIMICEAGAVSEQAYRLCRDRSGPARGTVFASGTLEADIQAWFPREFQRMERGDIPDSDAFCVPTWTNHHFFPGGRNDPEILRLEAESPDFEQRFAGRPVQPKGLVFPTFKRDIHVGDVRYDRTRHLYIFEDPGYGTNSAHALEIVQFAGKQMQLIDEIYLRGATTDEVIDVAEERPWWSHPNVTLVSDPNYKDVHHSQPAVSDTWIKRRGLHANGKKINILPGIVFFRQLLLIDMDTGAPNLVIAPHCIGILSELGYGPNPFTNMMQPYMYAAPGGEVLKNKPIDAHNHGIKAIIYGVTHMKLLGDGASGGLHVSRYRDRVQAQRERERYGVLR